MPKIRVHEKALAHLSRGLYRSPASALRELVSNAWDANAKAVRVNTNYPNFFQLSIEDTGDGFTKEEFARLMGGGIGNSEKRPSNRVLMHARPVIGRLGIGMLGIAQICGSFTITSKMKNGTGFRARVHLYDLLKERLDKEDPAVISNKEGEVEVDVGTYDFDAECDLSQYKFGTSIVADDVHPTFVRAFQQSLKAPKFQEPSQDWMKALKVVSSVHTLQELGDYWRLLWELATSCPIPYISGKAVPSRLIETDQKLLESYDFRVIVDGTELRKPVFLQGNPAGYTTRSIAEQHLKVYGKPVAFHGYIAVQEGAQLRPDELRGVLVRIKNVAIGYYDPSMLDYRYNEGPRSRWVTGEIFVTEGLEDALNIDRDSFNRFHPQFRAVQEYLHKVLHDEVFPEVYKQIDVRSSVKAQTKRVERTTHLSKILSGVAERKVAVKETRTRAGTSDSAAGVAVKEKQGKLEILIPLADQLPTKKSNRQLAASILAIFELAMQERDPHRKREVFRKSLFDLLAKW